MDASASSASLDDSNVLNISLKVLEPCNKKNYQCFQLVNVPRFEDVLKLKEYFVKSYEQEIQARDTSFEIGYFIGNRRFNITNEIHFAQAMSLEKKGWLSLWLCNKVAEKRKLESLGSNTTKRTRSSDNEDDKPSKLDVKTQRLKEKHPSVPDFKIRVWAKMLINGNHNSEEEMPNFPFFGSRKKDKNVARLDPATVFGQSTSATSGPGNAGSADEKMQRRGLIIKQLKDLKELKDGEILSSIEFENQRKKLVEELASL